MSCQRQNATAGELRDSERLPLPPPPPREPKKAKREEATGMDIAGEPYPWTDWIEGV